MLASRRRRTPSSSVLPQEVSSLYPCLVAFVRPDGEPMVSSTRCKRNPAHCYPPQAAQCCLQSQSCCSHPCQGSSRVLSQGCPCGLSSSTYGFTGSWVHVQPASEHPCLLSSGRSSSSDRRSSAGTVCT